MISKLTREEVVLALGFSQTNGPHTVIPNSDGSFTYRFNRQRDPQATPSSLIDRFIAETKQRGYIFGVMRSEIEEFGKQEKVEIIVIRFTIERRHF